MRKDDVDDKPADTPESLTVYQLKSRLTWAALIKCVYEVDPLKCPKLALNLIKGAALK
jgi:hypothetical protein